MKFPSSDNKVCREILQSSISSLHDHCDKKFIKIGTTDFFADIVSPLAAYLNGLSKESQPLKVCLSGGQGSGKTSLSEFLQIALSSYNDKKCLGFSIDDIYKTYTERLRMSKEIHPLCKVRGVPGTHDIDLGINTILQLVNATEETKTLIPAFSKPNDRRVPKENWNIYQGRPDIILFDAWCGGVPAERKDSWDGPINSLEESEDPEGVWWNWSNEALGGSYQELFSLFDLLIMIEVPDIQTVFDSRWLQEQTLSKNLVGTKDEHKIMNREEVDRFVMHYERLTLHILKEVPAIADIVIKRDRNFQFIYSKTPR